LTQQTNKTKNILVLTPLVGSLIFVLLYVVAAHLYPGGSQVDKNAAGFSWTNNYWCNLLNENAINGQPNAAKPVAMAGMFVLCVTLACFWFLFPKYLNPGKKLNPLIQISGLLAMTIAFFLFTTINHDLITNLASIFGLIATLGTFIGLYKAKWYKLLAFGFFLILLVGINNYVYYSKGLIIYLPVIQKISFAAFLLWISCVDICIYRELVNSEK
jgi:hypothetical protein